MHETTPPPQVGPEQRELLDQTLDKWSLQVLDALCERPRRFNELRRAVPVVTQKSLTATLRRLERNGMVDRVVVSTRPIAVEYRISPLGRTLQDHVREVGLGCDGCGVVVALVAATGDDEERDRTDHGGEGDG